MIRPLLCLFLIIFASLFLFLYSQKQSPVPPLTGKVITSKDLEYEKERLGANYSTCKDKFPKVIVYCQNTQDIQNAILWARYHKMQIRIRSGGHNHEGYSTGNDLLLLDVSEMKKLEIDSKAPIAVVEPGLNNKELYTKLFQQNLTHVGGTCSEVGVSGLVLSGGMGPLLRKHGLTCDNVLAFDMVDFQGQIIHATKDNAHQDLFWALCGGGAGNFGVVSCIQMKVYPADSVTWFHIAWDWDDPVEEIVTVWQNFFQKSDRKWFSHLDIWARPFPSEKLNKKPIQALGIFFGTPEEAKEKLSSLLEVTKPKIETIKSVDWITAIKLFEDSTAVFLTDKPEYKSSGAFAMTPLPAVAIQDIAQTLKKSPSPFLNVLFSSMGGALSDVAPSDSAFFYRDSLFFINYTTQWLEEPAAEKQKRELTDLRNRLLPFTEGDYVGNPDSSLTDYLTDYYGKNVERLELVKCKYDPENVFQFEQSIPCPKP